MANNTLKLNSTTQRPEPAVPRAFIRGYKNNVEMVIENIEITNGNFMDNCKVVEKRIKFMPT